MGLFSFFSERTSRKAVSASPVVLEALAAGQFSPYPALGGTNLVRERVGAAIVTVQSASYGWMYLRSPSVRRVIDYIAVNVAQLGLKVYERVSDDEREHVGDHPAARALRMPNPQTPGEQFVFDLTVNYLVYDNAYCLKFRGATGLTLVVLPPHMVGIVGQSLFSVDAYRIYRADGTFFDCKPEDMIHWRGSNPEDPRKGESKLETLRQELAADAAARQAVTELHRSGLTLPGWIERPVEAPEWSEEGRKRFQESFANQARDSTRHYPVLEEGMLFKQGGVTPEDAEMLAGRRFTLEQVSGIYGMKNVPPEGEEERKQFYADVLPPITDRLAGFLNLQVLQQEYNADDHYFEFNLDEKLMGDDRLKALTSAAGVPPLTRNEARARLNLPAKDGGDELITPLNVLVGDNPRPSPQVMPIQDPNKPPQDGSHRSDDEPLKSMNGSKRVPLVPRRRLTDQRRDKWAGSYQEKLSSHFTRQRQSIQSKTVETKAAQVTSTRWNEELAKDLVDVSRRQFQTEGDQVSFRLASEFDPGQGENWLKAKATAAAEGINSTTREHIQERGVVDAFVYAVEARAVAAGLGYATDIAGFAAKAAVQQSPDGEKRIVVIDGGDCPICAEFQGAWPVTDVPGWPSYHPGCNCIADIS